MTSRILAHDKRRAGGQHLQYRRPAAIKELLFEWNDVFDIDVSPAASAAEGLRIGPDVFGRLPRMQG